VSVAVVAMPQRWRPSLESSTSGLSARNDVVAGHCGVLNDRSEALKVRIHALPGVLATESRSRSQRRASMEGRGVIDVAV